MSFLDVDGSYRAFARTNLVTGVAAGTASAGHILAMQVPQASAMGIRLKTLEVSCTVLTAFTAAQEVGFDLFKATGYSAAHTGGLGVLPSRMSTHQNASQITATQLRVSDTGALTNGTETLDTDRLASDSFWAGAVGANLLYRAYDFSGLPLGGLILLPAEGVVGRNTVLMGAAGVVRWMFGITFDEVVA